MYHVEPGAKSRPLFPGATCYPLSRDKDDLAPGRQGTLLESENILKIASNFLLAAGFRQFSKFSPNCSAEYFTAECGFMHYLVVLTATYK